MPALFADSAPAGAPLVCALAARCAVASTSGEGAAAAAAALAEVPLKSEAGAVGLLARVGGGTACVVCDVWRPGLRHTRRDSRRGHSPRRQHNCWLLRRRRRMWHERLRCLNSLNSLQCCHSRHRCHRHARRQSRTVTNAHQQVQLVLSYALVQRQRREKGKKREKQLGTTA